MGIIAWIVLGLGAGLLANMLIPGKRSQGLIITCLIGIAGALLGGWAATKLFHLHHPPCRDSSTPPPGSPPSPVRPSCCSPTTWSPAGPGGPAGPAGSRTAENRQGCSGFTAQPGQPPAAASGSGRRMPRLSLLACDFNPRSAS